MKVFFRRIHLYLGLTAGLVITLSCLTGAMLVFEKEITEALNHDRYFVTPAEKRVPLSAIINSVKQEVPGANITRIQLFADPTRTVQVLFEEKKKEKRAEGEKADSKPMGREKGKGAAPKKEKGRTAFVNPYTGQVIELYSYQATFYYKIFAFHRWLLAGDTGKIITGTSTFIFLFILITGIILWWPKTRNILKQRLKVKWDGNWKRVNNDLHVVLGFYTSIFLFVIAFGGVVWSFDWFSNAFYSTLGGNKPATIAGSIATEPNQLRISPDDAFRIGQQQEPNAYFYTVNMPKDSSSSFVVNALPSSARIEVATTAFTIDQYSGKVLQKETFSDRKLGTQVKNLMKPIHTGTIYGTPTKIFYFVIALLGAIFPATGTIMWLNRTRKQKKKPATKTMETKKAA
ncbi:PepSY domain-containing protein [Chitinophaga sp. Cy-1792]|uniref:PepSY-associated TM helix domain-containing protein n=1 Tax=Chitinophaga sp. Cy-1792 TaxID=2608339 RepID=UPI0014225215|nr:PepSY-associated TM helix domain-containing protein [Chitinophaga sp. Cy-1792]NIG54096.1 PepSY domain-containing protein [Chitinophaga sp. Cy-1792]